MGIAVGNTVYRVRRGARATMRVVKWDGDEKQAVYIVEPGMDGWLLRCTCPSWQYRHAICRHAKLVNLLGSGRLQEGQAYCYDGKLWSVAGELPRTARPAVSAVQS